MVTWREFESEAPDIAAVAVMVWPGIAALSRGEPRPSGTPWFPVPFLATAGRDGSLRLHPFCPGPRHPGRPGQGRRAAIIAPSRVGGMIETATNAPVFESGIVRVDTARWPGIGQPRTRAVRQTWKAQ